MGELITRRDLRVADRGNGDNEPGYVHLAKVKSVYLENIVKEEKGGKKLIPAGTIDIGIIDPGRPGQTTEILAYPFQESFVDLPVEGELVEVYSFSNKRYYRKILVDSSVSRETLSKLDQVVNQKILPKGNLGGYINPGSVTNVIEKNLGLDKQSETRDVHRVSHTKGNLILQSRYGQSIRLSSFLQIGDNNPLLTIRNGESDKSKSRPKNSSVEEDINGDGSTIEMSSGTYVSKFVPGTPKANGSTNFTLDPTKEDNKITPSYGFENYPSKLDGNQIVITSDRLVFSSRKNEMIFWSKDKFGVITDEIFSVDAGNGMNLVCWGENHIDIEAKQKSDIRLRTSLGKVYLGWAPQAEMYPAVIGSDMSNFVGELLDILRIMAGVKDPETGKIKGGIKTPSGPTCGPTTELEEKLNNMAKSVGDGLLFSSKVMIAK